LHIPLKLGLLGGNGQDVALKLEGGEALNDGVLPITKRKQVFRFADVPSRPVPSLLRGFSAPVNVTIDLSDDDVAFLMGNDTDPFNRWQAANNYATRILVDNVRSLAKGKRASKGQSYAKALGAIVMNDTLEPAYRAELLRLPSPSDIARVIGKNVDPALIYRAHCQLSALVGRTLGDMLEDIYENLAEDGPFSPDAENAGRRAMRNGALTLLTARRSTRDLVRLSKHYAKASNMTDRAHALFLLGAQSGVARENALNDFYKNWKGDNIVIDTWFAAQAQSPLAATLRQVKKLTKHPLFSLTAPNKVRALIGTFAMANPVQFNRPDGTGYAFLADQVLALDRLNPQIAARMLSAFRSWRALETGRRGQARKALQRIAKAKGSSPDVQEIVSKMLES
jgi:aminopeptidase N